MPPPGTSPFPAAPTETGPSPFPFPLGGEPALEPQEGFNPAHFALPSFVPSGQSTTQDYSQLPRSVGGTDWEESPLGPFMSAGRFGLNVLSSPFRAQEEFNQRFGTRLADPSKSTWESLWGALGDTAEATFYPSTARSLGAGSQFSDVLKATGLRDTFDQALSGPAPASAISSWLKQKGIEPDRLPEESGPTLKEIIAGTGVQMLTNPFSFLSAGSGNVASRIATRSGKLVPLTEAGAKAHAGILRSLISKVPEVSKTTSTEAIGLPLLERMAADRMNVLSKTVPGLFQKPGVTFSVPFLPGRTERVIPGTPALFEGIGSTGKKIGEMVSKFLPKREVAGMGSAKALMRETERVIARSDKSTLLAEGLKLKNLLSRAKELGFDPSWVMDEVSRIAELPAGTPIYEKALAGVPEFMRPHIMEMKAIQAVTRPLENVHGVPTPKLGDAAREKLIKLQMDLGIAEKAIPDTVSATGKVSLKVATLKDEIKALEDSIPAADYIAYIMTPEAKAFLERRYPDEFAGLGRLPLTTNHASMLQKTLGYLGIQEANRLAAAGKLKGWEGFSGKIFSTNPAVINTVRLHRMFKSTQLSALGKELRGFGAPADADFVTANPEKWIRLPFKSVWTDGMVFPKPIAEAVEHMVDRTRLADDTAKYLRIVDGVSNVWRKLTVIPFMETAVKNLVGNLSFNGYFVSPSVEEHMQAARIFFGLDGNIADGTSFATIREFARRNSVLGTRIGNQELMGTATGAAEDFAKLAGSRIPDTALGRGWHATEKVAAVAARPFSYGLQFAEDVPRLAIFIKRRLAGDTWDAAGAFVRRFQGDPAMMTGVSSFEKDFMRRIFMFYNWARFNLPLSIMEALRRPSRISALLSVEKQTYARTISRGDIPFVPEWVRTGFGIPVEKKGPHEYAVFSLGRWISMLDLAQVTRGNAWDAFINYVNPVLRLALEVPKAAFSEGRGESFGPRQVFRVPWLMPEGILIKDAKWGPILANIQRNLRLATWIDSMSNELKAPERQKTLSESVFGWLLGARTSGFSTVPELLRQKRLFKDKIQALKSTAADALRSGNRKMVDAVEEDAAELKRQWELKASEFEE